MTRLLTAISLFAVLSFNARSSSSAILETGPQSRLIYHGTHPGFAASSLTNLRSAGPGIYRKVLDPYPGVGALHCLPVIWFITNTFDRFTQQYLGL
jgi:hypothetical protein